MGQLTFAATTAATQVLENIAPHKIGKVSAFEIANNSTDIVTAFLQRVFTPDASNGVAAPAANNTEVIATLTAAAAANERLGADDLVDLRAFGKLQCICDASLATPMISVRYRLD
jgi:hypothetical protein